MAAAVSIERFKREIHVAAKLQQANIVPLLAAGDADGLPYYVMPYVRGESLRARLSRDGELPVADAIGILREVARALADAQSRRRPPRHQARQVLLSGGSAMVTDFGVAKALTAASGGDDVRDHRLGMALGTPAYMSPEQASADPHVDHRADIYAFGCMAYELLTGQTPFTGRTPAATLAAHVSERPESLERRRPSVPPALAALVSRCLEKRPSDRPQSAQEVLHALDSLSTPSGGMQPTTTMLGVNRRNARRAFTIIGVVAGVVLAGRDISPSRCEAQPATRRFTRSLCFRSRTSAATRRHSTSPTECAMSSRRHSEKSRHSRWRRARLPTPSAANRA